MSLDNVKNIILILSGKGGVGKSSITTQLALALTLSGHSVGILDVDLTGPSMPRLLGVESRKITQSSAGWLPVQIHPGGSTSSPAPGITTTTTTTPSIGSLHCMSLGFLLRDRGDAVVWRGPKKTAMVRQLLDEVAWGALDYLLIDTPPGTSDEHIALVETLTGSPSGATTTTESRGYKVQGAVVVTTPQAVATADVRKELNFCVKTRTEVLGVVENMAGFVCPNCSECTAVFSSGGGRVMADECGVPFLGSVPLDPQFGRLIEEGRRPVYPDGTVVGGMDVGRDGCRAAALGVGDGDAAVEDEGRLVDKWQACSLYPIFRGIADRIVKGIESRAPT
ncbi:MAG: hypothetical protein M1825_005940 [Sarcosagium campestre]|nr:MAG: hypothetical protein M1825_005940 [Sarcosagium campestre]